jgi:hypothetical protein
MPKVIDLTGQSFGSLVVVRLAEKRKKANGSTVAMWVCICECGREITTYGYSLRSGQVKSCGCIRTEQLRERLTTHGMTKTPEYNSFRAAKERCTNPNGPGWEHYGGRGIEFRFSSFEEFFAEVGPKPEPKRAYSIDRIDKDGHYEPGNVRWATRKEQNANKRAVRNLQAQKDRLEEVAKRRNKVLVSLIALQAKTGWPDPAELVHERICAA